MIKLLYACCLATSLAAAALPATPDAVLNTLVVDTALPFPARRAVRAVVGDREAVFTLAELVRLEPARFAPAAAAMIEGFLKTYDLRLGLSAAELVAYAQHGTTDPVVDFGSSLRPSTKKALTLRGVRSAKALARRFDEGELIRTFERDQGPELLSFAAEAGAPVAKDEFADLSDPLRAELRRLKVTSFADFSRRFTFSELYRYYPMPPYWDEMIAKCLAVGHPVSSGARRGRGTCAEESAQLFVRARKALAQLSVEDAGDLAARYSLMALRNEGVGLKTMQELMDWAETCGAPLSVTEAERLASHAAVCADAVGGTAGR